MKRTKKVKRANEVKKVNLGAIFDAHVRHEFVDHDVAATMKTTIRRVTLPEGGGASI